MTKNTNYKESKETTDNINWSGFFSHANWLSKEKNNSQEQTIINYLNYILLSPNLLKNISLTLKTLSFLSFQYYKIKNIYGLDWIYQFLNKKLHSFNNENALEVKLKVVYRYASVLNSNTKWISYAKNLLDEIQNVKIKNQKLKEEIMELKNIINNKLSKTNNHNNEGFPFDCTQFEEDCWNSYVKDDEKCNSNVFNDESNSLHKESTNNVLSSDIIIDINSINENWYDTFQVIQRNETQITINELQENINIINNDIGQNVKLNKTKVLILSSKIEQINLPCIPRYIYWKDEKHFNSILEKIGIINSGVECYKLDNKENSEKLLYIVYSYITHKQLLFQEKITISEFISSEYNNNNYILIIASLENVKSLYLKTINIPIDLKPFLNFSITFNKLKQKSYYYIGQPLQNFGNTCFINAGLQCILHCNLLSYYFVSNEYLNYVDKQNEFVQKFVNFVINSNSDNLQIFIDEFRKTFSKYEKGKQYDSTEFVTDLLTKMSFELSRAKYELHEPTKGKDNWEQMLQQESSIITDLFYGQIKYTQFCKCKFRSSERFEEFLLLDLQIPKPYFYFVLYKIDKTTQIVKIDYCYCSELTCGFVRQKMKLIYNRNVIVLYINYSKEKVYILEDKIKLINKGNITKILEKFNPLQTNEEFVLYEEPTYQDIQIFYLVPFVNYSKTTKINLSTKHKFKNITGYPIQIIVKKPKNKELSEYIQQLIKNTILQFTLNKSASFSEATIPIFDGKKLYDFNDINSIENFVNANKNEKNIILFTKTNQVDWKKNPDQFENNLPMLKECLNILFESETSIKCDQCNSFFKLTSSFTRLPYYLIIYFKRFYCKENTNDYQKNGILIDFPEKFTLEDNEKNKHTYKAFAINVHKGEITHGHYYAICKEQDQWYILNDNLKKKVDFKSKNDALLVFYEKQELKN